MADDRPEDTEDRRPIWAGRGARRRPSTSRRQRYPAKPRNRRRDQRRRRQPALLPAHLPWPSAVSATLTAAVTGAVAAALCRRRLDGGLASSVTAGRCRRSGKAERPSSLAARVADPSEVGQATAAAPRPGRGRPDRRAGKIPGFAAQRTRRARASRRNWPAELNGSRRRPTRAPPPDLAAINERIAQIERTNRTQSTAIAQADAQAGGRQAAAPGGGGGAARRLGPARRALRRRAGRGEVARARSGCAEAARRFAASGVPNPGGLSRELLALVPKLRRRRPRSHHRHRHCRAPAGGRGQAGSDRAHRRRGNDRGAIVARVTAAALRNDFAEARRELKTWRRPIVPPRKPGSTRSMPASRARRLPPIRGRGDGGARQTGAIGFRCSGSFCFWC